MPFPDIDPVLIEIGPLAIRWYALAYIAGLLGGWWYMRRMSALAPAPVSATAIDDLLAWATLGVVLGGRFGYVLFYKPGYYLENPLEALMLWKGGMAFHGGMLGVIVVLVLFCRARKLPLLVVGDMVCRAVPIGLFFGRIANFINGELWGRPAPGLSWAMIFPRDPDGVPRHPSQLYEAALEGLVLGLVLFVLWRIRLVRERPGVVSGLFLAGYGLARFTAEFYREPDAFLGFLVAGATMGQLLSLPMILVGAGLAAWAWRRR